MSKIIENARKQAEFVYNSGPFRIDEFTAVCDYAAQLEILLKRYTGCKTCAHHSAPREQDPCRQCIADKTYSMWELAR